MRRLGEPWTWQFSQKEGAFIRGRVEGGLNVSQVRVYDYCCGYSTILQFPGSKMGFTDRLCENEMNQCFMRGTHPFEVFRTVCGRE